MSQKHSTTPCDNGVFRHTDLAPPPDFSAETGPVRSVLVLDVLGRTVLVDEGRHREMLATLAAWEAMVQARASGVKQVSVPGDAYEPEEAPPRKAAGGQPGLFGG